MTEPREGPPPVPGEARDAPKNRMAVAVLSLIGAFLAFYLVGHNLGWTGPIQCGVGDCGTVQSSEFAWIGPVPVSGIGFMGYLALFAASILGLQPRFRRSKGVSVVLFGGALAGVGFSGYLTYLEAAVIRAWCQYCVVSAILITVIFLITLPELRLIREEA